MNKYYVIKNFDNDIVTVTIKSSGYGKCYHEVKKDILDDIKKDIIEFSTGLDVGDKFVARRVLEIIEKKYFD